MKVLRFCYGEAMKVVPHEVCPVVAAVCRLQLRDTPSMLESIATFAVETAKNDLRKGAAMLCDCMRYEECCNKKCCQLDEALAAMVLTKDKMAKYEAMLCKYCLLISPPRLLDMAQYASATQEFAVRTRYARMNKELLSTEELKVIVSKVCGPHLKLHEIEQIGSLELFSGQELYTYTRAALRRTQQELSKAQEELRTTRNQLEQSERTKQAKQSKLVQTQRSLEATQSKLVQTQRSLEETHSKLEETEARVKELATKVKNQDFQRLRLEQIEIDRRHTQDKLYQEKGAREAAQHELALVREQLAETKAALAIAQKGKLAWQACSYVCYTRSSETLIKACGPFCCADGGSVYDDKRRLMIGALSEAKSSGDLIVAQLSPSALTVTVKSNVVPFSSCGHAPVYDGARFVYFMEDSTKGTHRFGRVNVDTWAFEELPPLPVHSLWKVLTFLQPAAEFLKEFGGCWHNGAVYALDNRAQLCAFDAERKTWSCCGFTLKGSISDEGILRLLSNPHDPQHLYFMRTGRGLWRVDLQRGTVELISVPPMSYDRAYGASLVALDKDTYIVVAALSGCAWHMFESQTNKWTRLAGRAPAFYPANSLVFAPDPHAFFIPS